MTEGLVKLLNAIKISCKGVRGNDKRAFKAPNAETAIVKIYENGKSEVMCRCLYNKGVVPRCNPYLRNFQTEDKMGVCPYQSKRNPAETA